MAFMNSTQIHLRAIDKKDANLNYLSWLQDEEITKGLLTGYFPSTLTDLENYIQSVHDNERSIMFAICENVNDKHIGNVKIDNFDWIARTVELGLLIGDKNYWGKGIGSEVCKLTIDYVFQTLNFRKIILTVYENNPRAIDLYKKNGFKEEGCLKKHVFVRGEYFDKYYMGLFNPNSK